MHLLKVSVVRGCLIAVTVLASAALIFSSLKLNSKELWFTNGDQDSTLLIDTLRVNAGREPMFIEHPGLGVYLLYGPGLKLLKAAGLSEVATIDELFAKDDPLLELPNLYRAMRMLSIGLVLAIAVFGGLTILAAGAAEPIAIVAVALLAGAGGFLFQSLIIRTELTSVFFIASATFVLALWTRLRPTRPLAHAIVVVSGVLFFLGVLSKVVVVALIVPALLFLAGWLFYNRQELRRSQMSALSNLLSWIATGTAIASLSFYFFRILPSEALLETRIQAMFYAVGALWVVQGISMMVKRSYFDWIQVPLCFLIGIFLAVPLLFEYANMSSLWAIKYVLNVVFSTGVARDPYYAPSLNGGLTAIFGALQEFLKYSILTSGRLVFFALAFLVSSPKGRVLGTLLFLCGLGMSLVMSLRYFGLHYLIYPDFFFALAAVAAMSFPNHKHPLVMLIKRRSAFAGLLCLVLLGLSFFSQYRFIAIQYPAYNGSLRDGLGYLGTGCNAAPEYGARMKERYGSLDSIIFRVISDPRLNGYAQNINILKKPQVIDFMRHWELSSDEHGQPTMR